MHNNGFVIAIKNSRGEILREVKDPDFIPAVFLRPNSPYSILLKNSHDENAVAEILVDGTNILGNERIIVPAHGEATCSRFCVDGNLAAGKELLYVLATDGRVQDPTSKENGIVRVRFWKEIPEVQYVPLPNTWTVDAGDPWEFGQFDYDTGGTGHNPIRFSSTTGGNGAKYKAEIRCANYVHMPAEPVGATVEGNASSQRFQRGQVGVLEDVCTEIRVRLRPHQDDLTVKLTAHKWCECGKKSKYNAKFCSDCGRRF